MPASAEDIIVFKQFACDDSIPDVVAIQYLENCGSIDQAVGNYYDNPGLYTVQTYQAHLQQSQPAALWEDAHFSQDRTGEDSIGSGIPAFQIHAADDSSSLRLTDTSNAPTRPPSRMSMRDVQENGVLSSSSSTFFGPAPREHYDPAQWAMVPSTSIAEILLDPNPEQRRRDLNRGEPVFMKPLPNKDPLASLITILGHIPLARNTLGGGPSLVDYGSNPEWWKGSKIELSSIIHAEDAHFKPSYELLEETQRLMAFIHSSTRSYGSVQPLSELKALSNAKPGMVGLIELRTLADRFLAAWSTAGMELALFPTNDIPFHIIDIKLSPTDITAPTRTLYDGADGLLWAEDPNGTSEDNYCLDEIPPVLFMRVLNQDASKTGLDMAILETWYLDRYLRKNMIAAKNMRNERSKFKEELQAIEEHRKKFIHVKHPNNVKMLEARELISSTINYLNPPKPADKEVSEINESSKDKENEKPIENGIETIVEPEPEPEPAREPLSAEQLRSIELANQLVGILEKVEKKLKDLDAEREKTQAAMAELSKLFTDPNATKDCPEHRYNLRGVSIGPSHVEHFVLVDPTKQEINEPEDEAVDLEAPSQWWRIQYLHNALHKQPVEIDNVLSRASETRDVLLVYANDSACERQDFDLADGLKKFVEKDNEFFSEEIVEHMQNSMHAQSTYQEDELPPAYSVAALPPNDGRWVLGDDEWTPDNGPSVLSDAEYRYSTSLEGEVVTSGAHPSKEDVRMGGLAVEHIEDVTEDDCRVKGG